MTYSIDYKLNVVKMFNNRKKHNLSIKQIIMYNNISKSSLYNWVNNIDSIKLKNKKKQRRISKISDKCKTFILNYVREHKQFQIKKLLKYISTKFKIKITKQSVYNVLKNNNYTNKKVKINSYPYSEHKLKEQNAKLYNELEKINFNYTCTDETALYLNSKPDYGWSLKGKSCEIVNKQRTKKFSLSMTITDKGITEVTLINGNFNAKTFNRHMCKVRQNKKCRGKKDFMDNAKIHHAKILNKNIKNNIIYNVAYCSKNNPIEMVFNTLKKYLNNYNIANIANLRNHVNNFVKNINSEGLEKYYNKSIEYIKEYAMINV